METVLITGVTGQIGSYMADYLLNNTENTVVGGIRRLSVSNHENIEHLKGNDRFKLIDLDITDQLNTIEVIRRERPDYFINCAANSFVGASWLMPQNHFETNMMPVLYQLEAIRQHCKECKYLNMGSSEEFGDVDYSPQDLLHPLKPRSPYGASKCSAHHIVKVWRESYGLFATQVFNFNTESERRGKEFVTRKISNAAAEIKVNIKKGIRFNPILLGNLNARRDWQHAEDCVDGLWKIINQDTINPNFKKVKDYILASGETNSIRDFVEGTFETLGIEGEWSGKAMTSRFLYNHNGIIDPLVKVNKEFFRPAEVEVLLGDPTDACEELGWKPKVDFGELVKRMAEHDYRLQSDR